MQAGGVEGRPRAGFGESKPMSELRLCMLVPVSSAPPLPSLLFCCLGLRSTDDIPWNCLVDCFSLSLLTPWTGPGKVTLAMSDSGNIYDADRLSKNSLESLP